MKKIICLSLLLLNCSVGWACESYEDCMAESRFIGTCDDSKECAGMLKHNKDMMPYIERAIAYKLDDIEKKLDKINKPTILSDRAMNEQDCIESGGSPVRGSVSGYIGCSHAV